MSRIISALGSIRAARVTVAGVKSTLTAYNSLYVSIAQTLTSPVSGAIGNAAASEATYAMNRMATNHVPDIANAMRAFWAGQLGVGHVREILANNGIAFDNTANVNDNKWKYYWANILKHGQPMLEVGAVIDLWRSHRIEADECRNRLGLHGITRPGDREHLMKNRGLVDVATATDWWHQGMLNEPEYLEYVHNAGIGDAHTITRLLTQDSIAPLESYHQWWLSGWIDDDTYASRLSRNGISNPGDQKQYLRERPVLPLNMVIADYHTRRVAYEETVRRMELHGIGKQSEQNEYLQWERPFAPLEALNLFYRGLITGEILQDALEANDIHNGPRQRAWLEGNKPLPGPSDLISFAVHEGWDQAVIDRFGYDQEFPSEFAHFMRMQGWDYAEPVPDRNGRLTPGVTWAKMYWRNHWMPMTASQATDAFHRLRPDRINRYADRIPDLTPFTWDDFNQALKIQDYAPAVRKFIAASSFSILDIRVVRRLYALGRRNRQWLIAQMQDRGYTLDDSNAIADTEDAIIEQQENAAIRSFERSITRGKLRAILSGYRVGTFSRAESRAALVDIGVNPKKAEDALDAAAAEENIHTVNDGIKRLRTAYLNGEFAPAELASQLASLRLSNEAITRYVQRWTVQRSQRRKMATTAKILEWVRKGMISPEVGRQRLINLGWISPDALLSVQTAVANHDLAEGRALAAADRSRIKLVGEMEAVAKKLETAKKQAQSELKRLVPIASLKKWFTSKLVGEAYVRERLDAMGYNADVADLYIRDWSGEDNSTDAKEGADDTPASDNVDLSTVTNPTKVVGGTPTIAADSQGPKLEGGSPQLGNTQ